LPEAAPHVLPLEPMAGPVTDSTAQEEGERVRVLNLLEESLAGRTIQETLDQSFLAVVEPWNPGTTETRSGTGGATGGDIYSAAAALGFQVYRLRGSYQSIRDLNLPAVLELKLGEVLGRRYVALVGLDGVRAEIRPLLSDGTGLVPKQILEDLWYGNAYILWKDWVGGRPVLMEGNQGEEVAWLQSALKELGYLSGEPTGTFGQNTGLAVRDFQKASGLEEDGILGPQTKIVLFRALKKFPMPLLESGGAS
jgi:general secretion pathway protein A